MFVKFEFAFKFVLLYQHARLLGLETHVECDKITHRPFIAVCCRRPSLVTLDRTLSFKPHLTKTAAKRKNRNNLLTKLAGSSWGADADTADIRISSLLLRGLVLCPSVVPFSPHWTGRRTVELHDASHFWHSLPNAPVATGFQSSPTSNHQLYEGKLLQTDWW